MRHRRQAEQERTLPRWALLPVGALVVLSATAVGLAGWHIYGLASRGLDPYELYAAGGPYNGTGPAVSPDGNIIVYSSPVTGHGDLYRTDRTGHKTRLTTWKDYDGEPCFSPDGQTVAFTRLVRHKGQIWLLRLRDGAERRLTQGLDSDMEPTFAPDGRAIVFVRVPAGSRQVYLYRVELASGRIEPLGSPRLQGAGPVFAPAGAGLFCGSGGPEEIWLLREDGRRRYIASGHGVAVATSGRKLVFVAGYGERVILADLRGRHQRTLYSRRWNVSGVAITRDAYRVLVYDAASAEVGILLEVSTRDGRTREICTIP